LFFESPFLTRFKGYQTSLALARAGAKVYIAAQSRGKAEESIREINKLLNGKGNLVFLELKLQSIAGAEAAGRTFLELESRLDIIVANAGIHSKNELSIDGIEMCMAVNVSLLSPFPRFPNPDKQPARRPSSLHHEAPPYNDAYVERPLSRNTHLRDFISLPLRHPTS
jgi:NAD(P)-dependent dehydrogenase (short-subunit alcohol dehydrogenase family)